MPLNKLFKLNSSKPLLVTAFLGKLLILLYARSKGVELDIIKYFLLEMILLEASLAFAGFRLKLLLLPLLLIHIAQTVNLLITGYFIEVEALLNLDTAYAFGWQTWFRACLRFLLLCLLWLPRFLFSSKAPRPAFCFSLFLAAALVLSDKLPIKNSIGSLQAAYEISTFKQEPEHKRIFLREGFHSGPSPIEAKDFNVIVLFAEGTSFELISEKLTPNTFALMKKSLSFENYFNHTASTYRGVRGSLASCYQLQGGMNAKATGLNQINKEQLAQAIAPTINLATILRDRQYKTIFLSPHRINDPFNNFLETLGFHKVEAVANNRVLSDKEIYQRLYELIRAEQASDKKFFIASYIFGTHEGMDSPDIKYADGDNAYLNKFHNQDYWLGLFLEKLEAEGLLKNTLLIYTSDHSTYPSAAFKQTFKSEAEYFVGRIPLLIYTEGLKPQIIDAANKNSLALAPTILNILDINSIPNYFLGDSLFASYPNEWLYISNLGFQYFDTSTGEALKKSLPEEKSLMKRLLKFFLAFG